MIGKIAELHEAGYGFIERGGGQPKLFFPGKNIPTDRLPLYEGDLVSYDAIDDPSPRNAGQGRKIASNIRLHQAGSRKSFSTDNPRPKNNADQQNRKKRGKPQVFLSGTRTALQISICLPGGKEGDKVELFAGNSDNPYIHRLRDEITIGPNQIGTDLINLEEFSSKTYTRLTATFPESEPGSCEIPSEPEFKRFSVEGNCTIPGKQIWFSLTFKTKDATGKKNPEKISISCEKKFSLADSEGSLITVNQGRTKVTADKIRSCTFVPKQGQQTVRVKFMDAWETDLTVTHPDEDKPIVLHLKYTT